MHIIADENVPRAIIRYLRRIGHHVLFIAEDQSLRGIKNKELLKIAKEQQAVRICSRFEKSGIDNFLENLLVLNVYIIISAFW